MDSPVQQHCPSLVAFGLRCFELDLTAHTALAIDNITDTERCNFSHAHASQPTELKGATVTFRESTTRDVRKLLEQIALARLELGEQIPEALYLTIAEIIAFAWQLRGKVPVGFSDVPAGERDITPNPARLPFGNSIE